MRRRRQQRKTLTPLRRRRRRANWRARSLKWRRRRQWSKRATLRMLGRKRRRTPLEVLPRRKPLISRLQVLEKLLMKQQTLTNNRATMQRLQRRMLVRSQENHSRQKKMQNQQLARWCKASKIKRRQQLKPDQQRLRRQRARDEQQWRLQVGLRPLERRRWRRRQMTKLPGL